MRQQYGLRVKSDEFATMEWDEFADLLSGLNEQTPLVRVAQIRTTTDRDVISGLTPQQRAIRAEWQRRRALATSERERDSVIAQMQAAFAEAFG